MGTQICEAIRSRRCIALDYYGHERVVEPYAYGTSETGGTLLPGFRIHGTGRAESN
jgi:hypothetical protein